jgi:putative tryptophan/tyrosine transport system substrate-binding protein
MNRRTLGFLVTLVLGLLAAPLAAGAPSVKVARMGVLSPSSPPNGAPDVLRHALRELGWVEGQNLATEYRWAHGRYERLPHLATELVRLPVDVLVTISTPAAQAAKQATTTLPIVMMFVSDAVDEGLVASLARPGGNLTGVSSTYDALIGKRLELLKEAVPGLSRVAVLYNPMFSGTALAVPETLATAQKLGVTPHLVEIRDPGALVDAFAAMTRAHAQALVVLADPLLLMYARGMAQLAIRHQLPTMFEERSPVEAGGLMVYGVNWVEIVRRAATYVDKILKGAKPADLPVEQPTKFELVINLKTAQALGLTISPTLLFQADEVIR